MRLYIFVALLMIFENANGQDIYISTHGTQRPSVEKVQQALSDWSAALGVYTMDYKGPTDEPCVDGAITYRVPSHVEWMTAVGQASKYDGAVFGCRPELGFGGSVVLLNPFWQDPDQVIYTHELGHAIGARHSQDPAAMMAPTIRWGAKILQSDVQLVRDCAVNVTPQGDVLIPAIGGAAVMLVPADDMSYSIGNLQMTFLLCPQNRFLPNGDVALFVVASRGVFYSAVLTPIQQNRWAIKKLSIH